MKSIKNKNIPSRGVTQLLLVSAVAVFAEHGFAGATVDDIVGRAGVNKRMVYHYFGDKEGIYRATLVEVFSRLAAVELKLVKPEEDTEALVAKMVESYFAFLEQNPEFVRLLLWENLQGGQAAALVTKELYKGKFLTDLEKILKQGVASGDFDPDLDSRHLIVQLIGLCLIYFSNRHTLTHSIGLDFSKTKTLTDGLDHIQHLLSHGLRNATALRKRKSS